MASKQLVGGSPGGLVPGAQSMHTAQSPDSAVIIEERRMMSRTRFDSVQVIGVVAHGEHKTPCFMCCNAPSFCRCCSILPCCDSPEHIVKRKEASKYITLRENSIEYNMPTYSTDFGFCCGISLCNYRVQDDVRVMYYDDISMDSITNGTSCFHGCTTCCCGSEGETLVLKAPVCMGCCVRASPPCCCVPLCCPMGACPGAEYHTLKVKNANEAVRQIVAARDNARTRMGI